MKCSIIIPTYNMKQVIDRALVAAMPQANVIVVDDGSTDGTTEYLKHRDITLIRIHKNVGMGAAVNIALKYVYEDYVIITAADDVIAPNCVKNWMSRSLTDVNYCRTEEMIPEEPERILPNIKENIKNGMKGIKHAHQFYSNRGRHIIDGAGCLCIKTSVLKKEKYDPNLHYKEGGELLIRLALKGYEFRYFDFIGGKVMGHKKSLHPDNAMAIEYIKNKYYDFDIS